MTRVELGTVLFLAFAVTWSYMANRLFNTPPAPKPINLNPKTLRILRLVK